jgi:hypothetical protein
MKMLPVKFYHQRARLLFTLMVICLAAYFITRFIVEF